MPSSPSASGPPQNLLITLPSRPADLHKVAEPADPPSPDAAEQLLREKQKLAHAGNRPTWADKTPSPTEETAAMSVDMLKEEWIGEIWNIREKGTTRYLRLGEFCSVVEEICECKQPELDDAHLIDLISELVKVFDYLPDEDTQVLPEVGTQVYAFQQLIKVVEKLSARWWVDGVKVLMSSVPSIKASCIHILEDNENKAWVEPLACCFNKLISMVEKQHRNNQNLRASAALVVISQFNFLFERPSESSFRLFFRAAKLLAHKEISHTLKREGFLVLLGNVNTKSVMDEDGDEIENEDFLRGLTDRQCTSLDEILKTMTDEELIQELQEAHAQKFESVYQIIGRE